MGQVFSSNGRECFGFGAEIPKPVKEGEDSPLEGKDEEERKLGETSGTVTSYQQTENEYPPGHPQYRPKSFKPAVVKPSAASSNSSATAAPAAAASSSDDAFRPFISPRYHLHLNLNANDPIPYGAEGALLEPCDQCVRQKRSPPTMVENDVCMCKQCWDEGTEDMRHVVRHRNNLHQLCPKDYPPSELQNLPDNSSDVVAHWRAEWRHAHGDHDLCRPHYLFGCTAVEELQLEQLHKHQAGNHADCPPDFPIYMLKPSVQDDAAPGEVEDELGEDVKEVWKAAWKHEHGVHDLCRASHNFGCDGGQSVPLLGAATAFSTHDDQTIISSERSANAIHAVDSAVSSQPFVPSAESASSSSVEGEVAPIQPSVATTVDVNIKPSVNEEKEETPIIKSQRVEVFEAPITAMEQPVGEPVAVATEALP